MKRRTQKISDFDPCGQKTFYPSRIMAWKEASRQNFESFGGVVKKPYKCKFCSGYHLMTIF